MSSRGEGRRQTPPSEPSTSVASTPPTADAPCDGLAALSLLSPGPVDGGAAAGGGAPRTPRASHHAATSNGAGPIAMFDSAVARPAAAAALPTLAGDASLPGDGAPVPVGDDGLPLSAEAAANPFSPPASERHAAFLKLVDSSIKAGLLVRYMRCADFAALAAEAGGPLFGDDSLIVVELRVLQAEALGSQASVEPDPAEKAVLRRRAWVVLLAQALPVLQSRIDKGILLPGTLRKVEDSYKVYEVMTVARMTEQAVPDAATLQGLSRLMGYDAALHGAVVALSLLPMHPWRGGQRERAQAFLLATLSLIPNTAGLLDYASYELDIVDMIESYMTPSMYGADFCASVLAMWRSTSVADVLRSRGALQTAATAALDADEAKFYARQAADLAKRGLRPCALPLCSKQETTVLQFRVCGHCQRTRYCCPEHAKQHWKVHKREYEAEEEGEATGGGGATA